MATYHLAANLLRLRTFHEYTQQFVSEKLHISRSAYSSYERGVRLPDLDTTSRMAEFFHMSLDCLILSPDPVRTQRLSIQETDISGRHTAITSVGSRIFLDGPQTHMHLTYLDLSENTQEEIREYVRFKKERQERQNSASKKRRNS